MLRCNMNRNAYVHCTMSKQLALASAAAVFAMSALALFAPGSAHPSDAFAQTGATRSDSGLAAPALAALLFPAN